MSPNANSDAEHLLAQLRSTIASLGAIRHTENDGTTEQAAETAVQNVDRRSPAESVADRPVVTHDASHRSLISPQPPVEFEPVVDMACAEAGNADDAKEIMPIDVTGASGSEESYVIRKANKQARIMIVDDEPINVMTFRQHLKQEGYSEFTTTSDSTEALKLVRRDDPAVVLLDINMPEVSGMDILRVMGLDPNLRHIPVLVLTASTDPKIRRKALDLGASDFLSKPIDPSELLPRVRNAIILKQHFDMVSGETVRLEQQVKRRTRQLEATRQQLILSLARAAEHRDNDTGNHILRVGRYTAIIAQEMGYPEKRLLMLEQAAQLHDVGKIGIPDSILFKPGKLDPNEYDLMKKHCALGKQIIEPISEKDWEVLK
ncbi:MAG: response regulator, partial [Fuerstiella sp.]|nr:response regulator [Fuerstiella sp.]